MKKAPVYQIAEIANVHAGNYTYFEKLASELSGIVEVNGIKFQPFKYDEIAMPDFSWFEVYKKPLMSSIVQSILKQ